MKQMFYIGTCTRAAGLYKTARQAGLSHVEACTLADVKFVVRPAGREKVRREGKKNVHAFAVGRSACAMGWPRTVAHVR